MAIRSRAYADAVLQRRLQGFKTYGWRAGTQGFKKGWWAGRNTSRMDGGRVSTHQE